MKVAELIKHLQDNALLDDELACHLLDKVLYDDPPKVGFVIEVDEERRQDPHSVFNLLPIEFEVFKIYHCECCKAENEKEPK